MELRLLVRGKKKRGVTIRGAIQDNRAKINGVGSSRGTECGKYGISARGG